MGKLEEALQTVEEAGYTVIDDRRMHTYYLRHETRLKTLLMQAQNGTPLAAKKLLCHINVNPTSITYSNSLTMFVQIIVSALLSEKPITTATKLSKRIKNPLLAAVLKTDSRTDYPLAEYKQKLQRRVAIQRESNNQENFNAVKWQSKRDALLEYIATTENLTLSKLKKYITQNH